MIIRYLGQFDRAGVNALYGQTIVWLCPKVNSKSLLLPADQNVLIHSRWYPSYLFGFSRRENACRRERRGNLSQLR